MKYSSKANLTAYAFLTPAIALLLVFSFWPVGFGSYIAFTKYNLIDAPQWVGLDNFRELLDDELFLLSLKNSAIYLLVVPIIQVFAILLAVLVNNNLPGIKYFRAAYYLPVVTTVSVIGVIWNFMYTEDGALNGILRWLHIVNEPIGFLNDDRIALLAVMFVTIWRGLGWYMVLYLAGLQAISQDVYEAATLDGANAWQKFWRITVPLLMPTILLCSIMSVLAAVKAFEEVQIMTQGGPYQSTFTALYYAYEFGMKSLNFGRALAASFIVSLFCMALAWLNFRYLTPKTK
ncbi:carbohydrate ABC transporter permease [Chitinimonas sp. BJB300]|uniref:carbohydrate ABC transporter permease n=1 Tax=Chitinimonas sp. BJB300 TaxID=1559339 RepID=UPI000C10E1DC|nr:sugar ABC transporter permease [Chitinimonas sp. BJB300]PHV12253.1 lactose ABC transporter permease [Chitinimonas sp. BJB300]TSJ84765.1 sugar ABC transporter permease [Chitinimonas sp. BJB300]